MPFSHETRALHRVVVRFSMVASWATALILTGSGILTDRNALLIEALAATVAALVSTAQVVIGRENALVTLSVDMAIVVFSHRLVGNTNTTLAAMMAVVALATVASVFVDRHRFAFLTGGSACIAAIPALWGRETPDAVSGGLVMAVAFLVGSAAFLVVRDRSVVVDERFRTLFDRAPVALMEQDWSEALALLDAQRPTDALHLQELLEASPDLVRRVGESISIVGANDAAAELLGRPREVLLGPLPADRLGITTHEVWIKTMVAMWDRQPSEVNEYQTADFRGNPMWVSTRTILTHPETARVVLASEDVTASHQRSQDLEELVRSKDSFIATVSHELRTPLTAVIGLTQELLASDDLGWEDRQSLMELVVGQANEISYLVEDLLVGARAEIGTVSVELEPVDIVAEISTVISGLDADPRVETETTELAIADPVRVRQIVRNLAVNAQRYGGDNLRLVVCRMNDTIVCDIRDDGVALGEEDRVRIFEPYTRAHARPGTTSSVGLGLAVSRQLAELMGGSLDYLHDGHESIFRLTLPIAVDAARASQPPSARAS